MRGDDQQTAHLFSYLSPEERVPADHPLRAVRRMTDAALDRLSSRFALMYSKIGRPSVPPEQLLRALLLQILYSVRSERMLMEQLEYNLLFRWFVGLAMDDVVWTPTTFTKNRERLLAGDVAQAFFQEVLAQADEARLMSDDHFTVDGTLLEACAGAEELPAEGRAGPAARRPGQSDGEFPWGTAIECDACSRRPIPTVGCCASRPSHEAKLQYVGGLLMENRHGLVVHATAVIGSGTAERDVAITQVAALPRGRKTVGGDKGFDQRPFVDADSRDGGHAARGAEGRLRRDRRPDDASSRLCDQSADSEADRRGLRLDEDRRPVAQAAPSRGGAGELDLRLHRGGLQPGPHADAGGTTGLRPARARPTPGGARGGRAPTAPERSRTSSRRR